MVLPQWRAFLLFHPLFPHFIWYRISFAGKSEVQQGHSQLHPRVSGLNQPWFYDHQFCFQTLMEVLGIFPTTCACSNLALGNKSKSLQASNAIPDCQILRLSLLSICFSFHWHCNQKRLFEVIATGIR